MTSPATGDGTSDSTSDGDEADASSEGPSPMPAACLDPQPLVQPGPAGQPSGFEQCADGFIHRTSQVECDLGGFVAGDCKNSFEAASECMSDDECLGTDGARGLCLDGGVPWMGCFCSYGCSSDADCAADEACICDGARSECIPAGCRTAADCGAAELCGLNQLIGGCGTVSRALSCTTPTDECSADAQCDDCLQCLRWVESDRWTCSGNTGICGPCG